MEISFKDRWLLPFRERRKKSPSVERVTSAVPSGKAVQRYTDFHNYKNFLTTFFNKQPKKMLFQPKSRKKRRGKQEKMREQGDKSREEGKGWEIRQEKKEKARKARRKTGGNRGGEESGRRNRAQNGTKKQGTKRSTERKTRWRTSENGGGWTPYYNTRYACAKRKHAKVGVGTV